MEKEEIAKLYIAALNTVQRIKEIKYYNAKSLEDLNDFVNNISQNTHWELTKSPFRFEENNLQDAQRKIGRRSSATSETERKELHRDVLFSLELAVDSHARSLYTIIEGLERNEQG